jgi:hypothetical protein
MELAGFLLAFALVFAAIMWFGIWRIWKLYRVITVAVPTGADAQAFRFKLTEAIRSLRYRPDTAPGPVAVFHAPAWQKWAVGLQDISVEPGDAGSVLVTGPAFNVSQAVGRFAGAAKKPYQGRQPVWPLVKGCMRIFATGIVLVTASILTAYLAGVQ